MRRELAELLIRRAADSFSHQANLREFRSIRHGSRLARGAFDEMPDHGRYTRVPTPTHDRDAQVVSRPPTHLDRVLRAVS